ncbi:hypothetical protein HQ303_13885, partial [Rhodococcus sp. BP-110]|nr:hypothetical protein [Rhodococcus sp. BP-110]
MPDQHDPDDAHAAVTPDSELTESPEVMDESRERRLVDPEAAEKQVRRRIRNP